MKKQNYLIVLMLITVLVFGMSLQTNATKQMVISQQDPPDDKVSVMWPGLVVFKDYVESQTQGEIEVKIVPGGALGDHKASVKQVIDGTIQGCVNATEGPISIFYPPIQAVSVPYLVNNIHQGWELLDSPFFGELFDDMRKELGVFPIAVSENAGFRCFTNNVREIRTPEDLKGLKIRTMEIPAHQKLMKSLGANPTPIAWPELYTSLKSGVVDGQENPPHNIYLGNFHEVQKYLTLDRHVFSIVPFLVNEKWYESLTKEQQKVILEGGKLVQTVWRGRYRYETVLKLKEFEEAGMQIYQPTDDELALFREKAEPVADYLREEIDPKWVDGIIEQAEKIINN